MYRQSGSSGHDFSLPIPMPSVENGNRQLRLFPVLLETPLDAVASVRLAVGGLVTEDRACSICCARYATRVRCEGRLGA